MGTHGAHWSVFEPLYGTWAGACLLHVVLIFGWVFGGILVAANCAVLADYTYGLSFVIFGVVPLKGVYSRRAWAGGCLLICACLAPRTPAAPGFWRYWLGLLLLALQSWIAWFQTIAPQGWLRKLFHDLDYRKYYAACDLRGELEDIQTEGSLFGFHPHGILCIGFSFNGAWSKRFLERAGEDCQFLIDKVLREDNPVFKTICDAHGTLSCCDKATICSIMGKNKNLAFAPGGFEEATCMAYGEQRAYIKKRTGFVKYALQNGYRVHPVWTFGESHTFRCFTGFLNFRLWLNRFGIPAIAMVGLPCFPILPLPEARILTCVGKAIKFPKIEQPNARDVAEWHGKYIEGLKETFESNKKAAGYADSQFQIY